MRDVTPFKYSPPYQPDADQPVTFDLTPLDLASFYTLQVEITRSGGPSFEVAEQVVRKHMAGWTGLEPAFSRRALAEVLEGAADVRWALWLVQICGELYRRALLPESERKN